MIKRWTIRTIISSNFGRQHGHVKAERTQQGRKQTVRFIAKAAAPARDDFRKQSIVIQHDWLAGMNAEILERNRAQVRDVQRAQSFSRWIYRTCIINSREVSRYIEMISRHGR